MQPSLPERIAQLALSVFNSLPSKCKPRSYPDGRREWTPLSAIIIHHEDLPSGEDLVGVSLGAGTKCLAASALHKCSGAVLHDCHAEVLALRGFNYWVLNEIEQIARYGLTSKFVERFHDRLPGGFSDDESPVQPSFRLLQHISIYIFSTEAPCGDASMELLMSSKSTEDTVPWSTDALAADLASGLPLGRGHFSHLGAMRRKPSRADAEPSMSKSCTDKLAMKQFTSLLAFPADVFVEATEAAFLKGMVVYHDQYHETAYRRAFGSEGRLSSVDVSTAHCFETHALPEDFDRFSYEKQRTSGREAATKATNISTIWIAGTGDGQETVEILVNGVKQGFKQFEDRRGKQSVLCRRSLIDKALRIAHSLSVQGGGKSPLFQHDLTYQCLKQSSGRRSKIELKQSIVSSLHGWTSRAYEDDFEIHIDT